MKTPTIIGFLPAYSLLGFKNKQIGPKGRGRAKDLAQWIMDHLRPASVQIISGATQGMKQTSFILSDVIRESTEKSSVIFNSKLGLGVLGPSPARIGEQYLSRAFYQNDVIILVSTLDVIEDLPERLRKNFPEFARLKVEVRKKRGYRLDDGMGWIIHDDQAITFDSWIMPDKLPRLRDRSKKRK